MVVMYGIKNCDTIKKARKWLADNGVEYQFHDYKKEGIGKEKLQEWSDDLGYEVILNTRGTTWRKLPDNVKENIDQSSAIDIMQENTSVIKRPIIEADERKLVGFNVKDYKREFVS